MQGCSRDLQDCYRSCCKGMQGCGSLCCLIYYDFTIKVIEKAFLEKPVSEKKEILQGTAQVCSATIWWG